MSSPGMGSAKSSDQFGPASPPAVANPAAPVEILRKRRRDGTGFGGSFHAVEATSQRIVEAAPVPRLLLRDMRTEKVPVDS